MDGKDVDFGHMDCSQSGSKQMNVARVFGSGGGSEKTWDDDDPNVSTMVGVWIIPMLLKMRVFLFDLF